LPLSGTRRCRAPYTGPFRGGLLMSVVPPGKRVVGMVDMVGVES